MTTPAIFEDPSTFNLICSIHLLVSSPQQPQHPHHHHHSHSLLKYLFIISPHPCCICKHRKNKKKKNKNLAMAADKCMVCLIDRLWFHQIILFSEPTSLRAAEDAKSLHFSSKHTSQIPPVVASAPPDDEVSSQESDHDQKERPTRLNLVSTKARSHSSSRFPAKKRSRNHRYTVGKLQKSMSCKSLVDLELEEVKGFMDLGFIFSKKNLTKRIINLVPGLQRIGSSDNDNNDFDDDDEDEDEEEEDRKEIMRPYLSEAWIIRRPDSPLLNLRIPRVSTAADMKKHLRYWAQTVASAIQQES